MNIVAPIEDALQAAIAAGEIRGCPPRLAAAIRHAVFPAGARIRPQLCLAVAQACGHDDPSLAMAAAISIEFLHCASLVHDDLPCFDDADMRRGQPSVHRAFGESLAVLAGDALIVLAFQTLARASQKSPLRLAPLLDTIGNGVGMPGNANPRFRCPITKGQRRAPCSWPPRRPAHWLQAQTLHLGARWATGWVRPTRWRTTSVM